MSSITIRIADIDVATTMSSIERSSVLAAERRRLKAAAHRTPDEDTALALLEFLKTLLSQMRDQHREAYEQAVVAQREGRTTFDALIHCPGSLTQTFGFLRQLGDRVDRLCMEGVLRCRPSTPAERDHRQRLCSVIEAELAAHQLVAAGE